MKTRCVVAKRVKRAGRSWKKKEGFSLIELLIVVVIIGILAGIAIPNFVRAGNKTKISRVFADFKNIGEALEAYAIDNVGYPSENDGFDALVPNYITSIPEDPFSNATYRYYTDAVAEDPGSAWLLVSHGPDGTEDVTDAAAGFGWAGADRVSGQLGGPDGILEGYGLAGGDNGWYDPEGPDSSDGDLGRGGP